jgi:hypothetical protein
MNAQELKETGDADAVASAAFMASVASALIMVIALFFLRSVSSFFLKNAHPLQKILYTHSYY